MAWMLIGRSRLLCDLSLVDRARTMLMITMVRVAHVAVHGYAADAEIAEHLVLSAWLGVSALACPGRFPWEDADTPLLPRAAGTAAVEQASAPAAAAAAAISEKPGDFFHAYAHILNDRFTAIFAVWCVQAAAILGIHFLRKY